MGKIERIEVCAEDQERLRRLARDRNTPQKVVWRARIVLLAGEGVGAVDVGREVGVSVLTVRRWRRRYRDRGVEGLLKDASRPPRRKPLSAAAINKVVDMTLHAKPPALTKSLEKHVGLLHQAKQGLNIPGAFEIQGHRLTAAIDYGVRAKPRRAAHLARSDASEATSKRRKDGPWCPLGSR